MTLDRGSPAVTEAPPNQAPRAHRWQERLASILLIVFCLEIGCFLLLFPWVGSVWQANFFPSLLHRGYWANDYLRGAVSGLGIVNLYISFAEMARLRRLW